MNATPGPWEVVKDANNHWGMREVQGPGVSGRLVVGFTVATNVNADDAERIEHDAALIAAAPDLLAGCKAAVEATGGSKHWNGETEAFLKLCEAAIAKATAPTGGT